MRLLPKWALLDQPSSIYDLESVTPLQQTARVYAKMQEMISEYNKFAEEINKEILEFVGSSETEISNFKDSIEKRICCKFNEIDAALAKIKVDITKHSDDRISEVYEQYLSGYASQLLNEKIASGELAITLVYDPETESLSMGTGEV